MRGHLAVTFLISIFLVAPLVNYKLQGLTKKFSLAKRSLHYQLTGKFNERLHENIEKLKQVFNGHATDFNSCSDVFNVTTQTLLPKQKTKEFLKCANIANELYQLFIKRENTRRKIPLGDVQEDITKICLFK